MPSERGRDDLPGRVLNAARQLIAANGGAVDLPAIIRGDYKPGTPEGKAAIEFMDAVYQLIDEAKAIRDACRDGAE